MNKQAILEGLLFLSGSEGLSLEDIHVILEIPILEVQELIQKLASEYQNNERGIQIEVLGDRFKLTTKQEHKNYYEKLVEVENNSELSQAALETLAIIAYNEPLTRVKVDEIRGVSSSHIVRKLVSMNLIQECGRAETPGRPLLYRTTKQFLDHFGLATLQDLPVLEEVEELKIDETDLFESKYKED